MSAPTFSTASPQRAEAVGSLRDCRVHAAHWGGRHGPPVLLIHAVGFDHRTWERLLPYLGSRFHLVGMDLPGHGESEKPVSADYGLWSLGARVARLLDELGWEESVLIGNSIGGGAALSAALQAPERVRGLALINSVAFPRWLPPLGRLGFLPFAPLLGGLAPPLAVRLGLEYARHGRGSVEMARITACNAYLRHPEGKLTFFRTLRLLYGRDLREMADRYEEIRCPALVVHGANDPLVRLPNARELARTIPSAEMAPLPRCGHFPQEECPEAVARVVMPFLDRVWPG